MGTGRRGEAEAWLRSFVNARHRASKTSCPAVCTPHPCTSSARAGSPALFSFCAPRSPTHLRGDDPHPRSMIRPTPTLPHAKLSSDRATKHGHHLHNACGLEYGLCVGDQRQVRAECPPDSKRVFRQGHCSRKDRPRIRTRDQLDQGACCKVDESAPLKLLLRLNRVFPTMCSSSHAHVYRACLHIHLLRQISAMSYEPASARLYVLFPEAAVVRAFQLPDWTLAGQWSTPGGTRAVTSGILWDGFDVVAGDAVGDFDVLMAMRVRICCAHTFAFCVFLDTPGLCNSVRFLLGLCCLCCTDAPSRVPHALRPQLFWHLVTRLRALMVPPR